MDSIVNRPLYITDSREQLDAQELARLRQERRSKVVLLADDDEDMVEIGKTIIKGSGYQFLEARNGKECLNIMLERHPHLVLLDLMMPVMSGYEVLKELTNNVRYRPVSETPIIMLTAKMENQVNRQELFELGLSAFLVKPFGSKELINIIDNVFMLDELKKRNRDLERRIRQTEYKYQDLIENASDLIFTLNAQGKFVFINRRLMALSGHIRDHWIGRDFRELIIPADQEEGWQNFLKTLAGRSRIFEMRIKTRENKLRYLSTNLNPIFEKGKVAGAVGIARDVTQQKKLEQQITELKNFNESIIQSIGSGLMTLDLNNKITSFNLSAEEILGYQADEVVGKHLDEIFLKEELEYLLPAVNGSEQSLMNREIELTTKNDQRIHLGFSVTPRIDNRGRRVGTIIAFRDISQIKQMQAEVIRMDRLASLGVLASGIAHEIRNPLAGIKTVAQTLEEEIDAGDSKREYLARIIRQVNRMDELLRAFFSYARPRPPVRKFYRLHEIVHEVIALLRQKMDDRDIKFTEEYAQDLPLIYVDFHQIQQVLFNLFLNAIDAMPDGGELRLKASHVYSTIQRVDRRKHHFPAPARSMQYAEVRISDTGMGIKKEDLQKIFDPFFTTKSQGSGLGLSIVYRIIEEHRGDIQVESVQGQGTTFRLLLPTEE
ncbi:MAG: PAS domain S-box protein [Calditrichaeota bacterium]|nr:MAG: PAS domain S-box protein [Calditrichota bacterium]